MVLKLINCSQCLHCVLLWRTTKSLSAVDLLYCWFVPLKVLADDDNAQHVYRKKATSSNLPILTVAAWP